MKILVTGGLGFIGSNFIRWVLKNTRVEQVINLDCLTYAGNVENLSDVKDKYKFYKGDIRDPHLVTGLVTDVEMIFNFAAESHVDRSIDSSAQFLSTNIEGVRVLMEAALASPFRPRFVQISTDEVYGSIPGDEYASETWSLMPGNPYAASKAAADLLVESYINTHGLDAIITRSTNNYGPYQHKEKFLPKLISCALKGENFPLYDGGGQIRDWLHVEDNCKGIWTAATFGNMGETYNIGASNQPEIRNSEVLELVYAHLGVHDDSKVKHTTRKGHDFRYAVNTKKIRELGWEPHVKFGIGVEDTIRWYVDNQWWWS